MNLSNSVGNKGNDGHDQGRICVQCLVDLLNCHSDGASKEEDRKKYRKVIATLSSDFDSFFLWLQERNDIMELQHFAAELNLVLQEVIYNRNVQLFNRFISSYLKIYIRRLTLTDPNDESEASLLYNSDVPELLSTILLSYPLHQDILDSLQEELTKLFEFVMELKVTKVRDLYVKLYQSLCTLYPYQAVCYLNCGLNFPYNDEAISTYLKNRFLAPWGLCENCKGIPNGCYYTDDQGQILIDIEFNSSKQAGVFCRTIEMEKSMKDLLPYIILRLKDGSLVSVYHLGSSVTYWQCPQCKAFNTSLDRCTSCMYTPTKDQGDCKAWVNSKLYPCSYFSNYYVSQLGDSFDPAYVIVYDSSYTKKCNLLQVDDTPKMEPVFHIFPFYELVCDFPLNAYQYNSFVCHLLLPQVRDSPLTFFKSDCISVLLDADSTPSISLKVNNFVKQWRVDPPTSVSVVNDTCVRIPVDTNQILSIFYCATDDHSIMIRICSHIVMITLQVPLEDVTGHISNIRLMNYVDIQNAQSKVGVLGIYLYNFESKHYWFRVPTNAAVFPTIGCHTTFEEGITKGNSRPHKYLNHKLRLYSEKEGGQDYSWQDFFIYDSRANDLHNMIIRSQFCFYNSRCCFNQNVSFERQPSKMVLGCDLRPGSMYWKTLLHLHDFELSMSFDMPSEPNDYVILWLSCMALPSSVYLSHIQKTCIYNITRGGDDAQQWIPSFELDWPIVCIILYHSDDELLFHYAYSIEQDGQSYMYLSSKQSYGEDHPVLIGGTSNLIYRIRDTTISLKLNDMDLVMSLPQEVWSKFPADGLVIPGLIGYNVSIYKFVVSSDSSTSTSYAINPTLPILQCLSRISCDKPVSGLPCNINYQNQVYYASNDPKLNNPPKYIMEGCIFSQNPSNMEYSIIAKDNKWNAVFFLEYFVNNPVRDIICVNQCNRCEIKHISSRKDSQISCFKSNRLTSFECVYGGLTNSYNTCFQNSTLQLIFHSGNLMQRILSLYKDYCESDCPKDSKSFRCMEALIHTLTRLQMSVRAAEFNDVMLVLKERFEIGIQHDMNEFFDYLMDAVDSCYQDLRKRGSKTSNPLALLCGTQQPIKETDNESNISSFQNSFISLTSFLYPVTDISLEVQTCSNIPSKPNVTYMYLFDSDDKNVFLALERDPMKQPISCLYMQNKKSLSSPLTQIPSFHTYTPIRLYVQKYRPSFICENCDGVFSLYNQNQLVVDVMVRVVDSTTPPVSQTNTGRYDLVGTFALGETNFEIYQKVVDSSFCGFADVDIQWVNNNSKPFASVVRNFKSPEQMVNELMDAYTCKIEERDYVIFSPSIRVPTLQPIYPDILSKGYRPLLLEEAGNKLQFALYSSKLIGTCSVGEAITSCWAGACSLFYNSNLCFKGVTYVTDSYLFIFDNDTMQENQFQVVYENEQWTALIYEGECYTFSFADNDSSRREYTFMHESNAIQLVFENVHLNASHLALSFNSGSSIVPGHLVSYDNVILILLPGIKKYPGCYARLEMDPRGFVYSGDYYTVYKKRSVEEVATAVFFSGIEIYYGVYRPTVNNLSLEALLSTSLRLKPTIADETRLSQSEDYLRIVKFPEYLSVAISRTFFDEKTYSLTKDCSHVFINPIISIDNEVYFAYAIVCHVGYSFDSGHYVVYCRQSDDFANKNPDNPANMWRLFNDDTVYNRHWDEVLSEISDYGTCPTFVMYRQSTSLSTPSTNSILPDYIHRRRPISEYCSGFVKEVEKCNDQFLLEVAADPSILYSRFQNLLM